ncbi:MAG: helix-turn-helix transcriptional regulator [Pseudomonadota bacterium]
MSDSAALHLDDLSADFSDDASTFGDRIATAREALGMSQKQLARRLGIKVQTLRNWEEDRSEPRANKLQMLAGMLNVSIIWLMSGAGEGPASGWVEAEEDDGDFNLLLSELRDVHVAQTALTARLGKLEKRLRALRKEEV